MLLIYCRIYCSYSFNLLGVSYYVCIVVVLLELRICSMLIGSLLVHSVDLIGLTKMLIAITEKLIDSESANEMMLLLSYLVMEFAFFRIFVSLTILFEFAVNCVNIKKFALLSLGYCFYRSWSSCNGKVTGEMDQDYFIWKEVIKNKCFKRKRGTIILLLHSSNFKLDTHELTFLTSF